MNDLFFHPAFQSVVFPGVLSAFGIGALVFAVPASGRRWAAAIGGLALAASLALLPGWQWPAGSAAQKLPWILAGGLAAALALEAAGRPKWTHWAVAALGWGLASQWVAHDWAVTPVAVGAALAGAAVLAGLTSALAGGPAPATGAQEDTRRLALRGAAAAATLAVASLGLAGLAAFGGSLLLAQLAAMVATVSGVLAAYGLRGGLPGRTGGQVGSRMGVLIPGPVVLMPLGLAWLAIAQAAHLSGIGAARLGVLALAFALPLLLKLWVSRRPGRQDPGAWSPVIAALAAALPAAAAIGWQALAPASTGGGAPTGTDDPYYEPRWK